MNNENPAGEIVLYQRGDAPAIDVRLSGDTVWLSLNQLADLLGRDKSTISRHISNVFAEGELVRDSVVAEFATTAADGTTYQVEHFNLDVITQLAAQPSEVEAVFLETVKKAQKKIEEKKQ